MRNSSHNQPHNTLRATLRRLLVELFSVEEVNNFAFDYFPTVYNKFVPAKAKGERARRIVAHAMGNSGR